MVAERPGAVKGSLRRTERALDGSRPLCKTAAKKKTKNREE